MKSETLIVRISPELKQSLREVASADGRSISNYVLMLIRSSLEKK